MRKYTGSIDPERCGASVPTEGVFAQWHQCSRKVWRDGWCKQHHPESVKARQEESQQRYEKGLEARSAPIRENKRLKEINAELLAACEAIHDTMYIKQGVDWFCRICSGYNYTKETVAHGINCPMGPAQAAIAKARDEILIC